MNLKAKFNELSVLAPLLTIYTLVYLALMGLDFVAKGEFDMPAGLMAVYFALLLAYAADKEIRRWTGKETPPRKGTLFVYLWLIFYLVVFIIHSLKPDYALPKDLTTVTLQVLGIFFGSKVSKKIFQARAQKLVDAILDKREGEAQPKVDEPAAKESEDKVSSSTFHVSSDKVSAGVNKAEEIILDVIRKNGQAKREDLMPLVNMSRSGLGRLLDEMEKKGLIKQIGRWKASYYKLK